MNRISFAISRSKRHILSAELIDSGTEDNAKSGRDAQWLTKDGVVSASLETLRILTDGPHD